jgi:hypothetical protein
MIQTFCSIPAELEVPRMVIQIQRLENTATSPQNTSILGAAKFSGKTRKGWSIGILESITRREMAVIDKAGQRREELVEPLTNYFVGRLQKDIKSGNTVIGGIVTAVNREKGLENRLHGGAYSGGLDFLHYWKGRTWYIRGNMVFSHVQGTKEAILRTQTGFEHLFQRADAKEVYVDSSRTSLTGMGGTIALEKAVAKGVSWDRCCGSKRVLRYVRHSLSSMISALCLPRMRSTILHGSACNTQNHFRCFVLSGSITTIGQGGITAASFCTRRSM